MQDRYVGDVGDFGKYGLLKYLCNSRLSLGVAWYLFQNESHTADGQFIGYLEQEKDRKQFRDCDPVLYDQLRALVSEGDRKITAIRERGILPSGTVYCEQQLSYAPKSIRLSRQGTRDNWINNTMSVTADADMVFVDPDNGISITVDPWSKTGPKFVLIDDLWKFFKRGQSLIVYHHLSRQGTHAQQIERWSECLRDKLGTETIWALRYRRGSSRVFFVIPQAKHESTLHKAISDFLNSAWASHFEKG